MPNYDEVRRQMGSIHVDRVLQDMGSNPGPIMVFRRDESHPVRECKDNATTILKHLSVIRLARAYRGAELVSCQRKSKTLKGEQLPSLHTRVSPWKDTDFLVKGYEALYALVTLSTLEESSETSVILVV
ncbi:hypothetical protein N7540_010794 [Penicillium herquei]|nr:hypothetical protein N7540_010794 [Penicillium herquei]